MTEDLQIFHPYSSLLSIHLSAKDQPGQNTALFSAPESSVRHVPFTVILSFVCNPSLEPPVPAALDDTVTISSKFFTFSKTTVIVIIFVVDEVSVIENSILARFLSEARKYNLSLILAGQYFSQISEQLRNAIFANIVNYYIFRISQMDANILVDNFDMKIPLEDTKDRKIKLLTELNNRECIVRIDADGILLPAFKGSTLDYQSIPRIKVNNSNAIINNECLPKFETKFQIDNTINLKDILLTTSSSRKDVK